MLLAFIYVLSFVLYEGVDAGSTCFCSATGDPHIRNFNGATSNVGAGGFTLIKDNNNKFSVDVAVAQTSATLTQIAEVNVKLAGDVVEDLPGYGQIHRADGIEIRVLNNNNVFIIWDAAKIKDIRDDTLCGGTCPDAIEDAKITTKVQKLEQTYGFQHNKVANLILSQVNSEIQIDELIRRLAQLKRQGARTDRLLSEIEKFVNNLKRRRRRRRDVDEEEEDEEIEEAEEDIDDATGTSLDEEVQFGDFGFAHTVDSSDEEDLDDTDYANMDVDKYVIELDEEEDFQNTEIHDLLTQQDTTNDNIKVMLGDTEVQLAAQTKIQKVVRKILDVLQANYSNIETCMDTENMPFLGCLKKWLNAQP